MGDRKLFHIEKAAEGVFLARAKTVYPINANSVIFVNSRDVLVVDTQYRPSHAAALRLQIQREITEKPVRTVVNTHFHDDHVQGNGAYLAGSEPVTILATKATSELIAKETLPRLGQILVYFDTQIERLTGLAQAAGSPEEAAYWNDYVQQLESLRSEMKDFAPVLPTVTFEDSYTIRDKAHDIHVQFHGPAHTAGDVVVYCPQKRVVATGDLIHDQLPYMPDCYPKSWPKAIDSIARLDFEKILPAHGPIHHDRRLMMCMRSFLEEVTGRVEVSKRAGKSLEEIEAAITVESLRSLQADGYGEILVGNRDKIFPHWGSTYLGPPSVFQTSVTGAVRNVYRRLDLEVNA